MGSSRLDKIYRRFLITKFFERGWGKPENLQRLFAFRKIISRRESCYKLVPDDYPVEIMREKKYPDCLVLEGKFISPLEFYLPGVVPKASRMAYFQAVLPNKWWDDKFKPVCMHLAGTGDHFFWRRRNFVAKPLLREANIGSIILENPFYGLRKPTDQVRSNLRNVTDIFVMGGCLILESLVLFHWCERNNWGPLGITGLSMGGHMASLAASNWPKPLVLVPCLSWSTAAPVFTEGVMSQSINWELLETQYIADRNYRERFSKMANAIDNALTTDHKFMERSEPVRKFEIQIRNVSKVENVFKNKLVRDSSIQYAPDINDRAETDATGNTKLKHSYSVSKIMKYILPHISLNQNFKNDFTKTNWWERETSQLMRSIMDECTHLKNFSVPFDTSLIIAICAKDDAYVPRDGCTSLEEIWPGVEVRYVNAGHVSAYLLHQKFFRSCIMEAFERAKKNYFLKIEEDMAMSTISYHHLLNTFSTLL